MGDRVSIQFKQGEETSPVLFNRWGGMEFVDAAKYYVADLTKRKEGITVHPLDRLEPRTVMVDFIRAITSGSEEASSLYLGKDENDGDNSDNGHHKDDGIIMINMGDSYSGSNCGSNDYTSFNRNKPESYIEMYKGQKVGKQDIKPKSKLLIPERLAIMMSDIGWIIRNMIIWNPPNKMPESVTDRFSKKYEHIIFAVKQPRYYFDLDAVREPLKEATVQRIKYVHGQSGSKHNELRKVSGKPQGDYSHLKDKNPGDVWNIPTQGSNEPHYAMWPEKLVERMILCSTKVGDIVLDCFAGSLTTLRVADRLNRKAVGIELGYQDMHRRRTKNIMKELPLR